MKHFYSRLLYVGIILFINSSAFSQVYIVKPSWQQNASVNDLKFNNDASKLITVGTDINIWNVAQGTLNKNIPAIVANPYGAVAISKDGKSFITSNGTYTCDEYCYAINAYLNKYFIDGTLNMHVSTGETMAHGLAYSPDGNTIAAAFMFGYYDVDGVVSIYDTSLSGIHSFYDNIPYGAVSVQFTPDGKYLISGAYEDGAVKIWDYHADTLIHSLTHGNYTIDGGNNLQVSISPDSKYVVTGGLGQESGKVKVWRIADGALVNTFNTNFTRTGADVMVTPAFSPDGKYIIAGISDGTIPANHKFMIWNFKKGTLLSETDTEPGYVSAITFSPMINNKYFFAFGLTTSASSTVNVLSIDGNNSKNLEDIISGRRSLPNIAATTGNIELLTNPFTNTIALKVSGFNQGKILATLSDLSGKPITKIEFSNVGNQTLNIPINRNINNGIYMLNVQTGNKNYNFRLIKN